MPELSSGWTIVCTGIFFVAGGVKGVTGMGLPTVAMGLLGMIMPPVEAAALLLVPSLITNVWQLWAGPDCWMLLRRFWLMMVGVLVGTVAAGALLVHGDTRWTAAGLGGALVLYATYSLVIRPIAISERASRWLGPLAGVLTGVVTGATGVFVVPAVPYLQALNLKRDELVQALGLSFTVSTVALGLALAGRGALDWGNVNYSAWAVLPALAGMWAGQGIRKRVRPETFRWCFLVFLALLGGELVARAWR